MFSYLLSEYTNKLTEARSGAAWHIPIPLVLALAHLPSFAGKCAFALAAMSW